ncbi:liprin-beta-2b isoform X2 [Latimeria chalumnae]|uniref:liprin-beta-2b isoform X2 n=1 Tax=Latimeria chalumnae TaxID=7897 RepID=UPI0003C12166
MASDASHMLEAALEQMDDIIAGTKAAAEYSNGVYDIGSPIPSVYLGSLQILQLVEELKMALDMVEQSEEKEALRSQIPDSTALPIKSWLEGNRVHHRPSGSNETYQERLTRLEGDRESLILQVSVLTDQVEAQGEKIRDLEACLEEHQLKFNSTEEMLQQELLSRTSLETQKLDLMAEVSNLKIKLVGMEKEQHESEQKQHKAEGLLQELRNLKIKVEELEDEKTQYEWKLKATKLSISYSFHVCYQSQMTKLNNLKVTVEQMQLEKKHWEDKYRTTQAEISQLQETLALKEAEIERLQDQISSRISAQSDSTEREDMYKRRLKEKHQEVQRLKVGMDSLLAANEEKDRRIEELTLLLNQYRKMKELMVTAHGSSEKILSGSSEEDLSGSLKRESPLNKAQMDPASSEISPRDSSPVVLSSPSSQSKLDIGESIHVLPETNVSLLGEACKNRHKMQQRQLSTSLEELQSGTVEKDKSNLENNKYQTLPGKFSRAHHNGDHEQQKSPVYQNVFRVTDESQENRTPNLDRSRSASAPALGETGRGGDSTLSSIELSPQSSEAESGQQSPVTPESKKNQKGIRKFWGKIRRTQSGNLQAEDLSNSEFRRGGLRATAGPRLSRTKEPGSSVSDPSTPFAQWNNEQVCNWLENFGLGQYVNLARQWVNSGHMLLTATPQDLEKELGIKNSLHRKKLQLSLRAISTKQEDKSGELDHIWVTRWLDDIGLPQYKDQFNDARVDGRMLQYLTVNDLLFLKVTSQLHHLSIKCAIHVLHVNKFNSNCLRRRPGDENNTSPSEVVQWSNHRVMEWLRSVDLAEYAPNLRGSGVHGGLIILEPRFNADTLAMLLNIPPQKTLLRRHLATNFNVLIGLEARQEKREVMESSSYVPLTTTAKVRPKKLGFSHFGNLRKKKFDESTDYICPMLTSQIATNGAQKGSGGYKRLSPTSDSGLDKLEQMEDSEGTVMQIGAFSEDINKLTSMLGQDKMLNDYRPLASDYEDWK